MCVDTERHNINILICTFWINNLIHDNETTARTDDSLASIVETAPEKVQEIFQIKDRKVRKGLGLGIIL